KSWKARLSSRNRTLRATSLPERSEPAAARLSARSSVTLCADSESASPAAPRTSSPEGKGSESSREYRFARASGQHDHCSCGDRLQYRLLRKPLTTSETRNAPCGAVVHCSAGAFFFRHWFRRLATRTAGRRPASRGSFATVVVADAEYLLNIAYKNLPSLRFNFLHAFLSQ